MSNPATKTRETTPYERALDAALKDLASATSDEQAAGIALERAKERVAELNQLVQTLLKLLSPEIRAAYSTRLPQGEARSDAPTRGGVVFDNVVSIFKNSSKQEWTPSEVQTQLAQQGIQSDPKEVGNILGYLARNGRIRRMSRGCYQLIGYGALISSEDIKEGEFGQSRLTEHDN